MSALDLKSNVSRETFEMLRAYEALVLKWTKRINLVSKSDTAHLWDRHVLDSAQVFDIAPTSTHWVDIGSGGGFPGVVCAIMAKGVPDSSFTFIDSDARKCTFLRTAIREFGLNAQVLSERIEHVAPQRADVLTARALDDLSGLLEFAERHLSSSGVGIFPKGSNWKKEHEAARQRWSYKFDPIKSTTNPDAIIMKIKELRRA